MVDRARSEHLAEHSQEGGFREPEVGGEGVEPDDPAAVLVEVIQNPAEFQAAVVLFPAGGRAGAADDSGELQEQRRDHAHPALLPQLFFAQDLKDDLFGPLQLLVAEDRPAAVPQSAGLHRFALEKAAVAGRFTQIQQLRLERVMPVDEVGELQVLQLLIGVRAVRLDQEHVAAVDRAAPLLGDVNAGTAADVDELVEIVIVHEFADLAVVPVHEADAHLLRRKQLVAADEVVLFQLHRHSPGLF